MQPIATEVHGTVFITRRIMGISIAAALLMTAALTGARAANGALTLEVAPVPGTQAVHVQGSGPAGASLTIALYDTISQSLPTVFLSSYALQVGSDGHFAADVRTAPAYTPGSLLTVVATSVPGVSPAQATLVLQEPNVSTTIPVEQETRHPER